LASTLPEWGSEECDLTGGWTTIDPTATDAALTGLQGQCRSRGMASGDSRPEQRICRDANEQEDRDHDRRNEVPQDFPRRSQQRVECHRDEAEAGEHHRGIKTSLRGRTSLLLRRHGSLLACRQEFNQSLANDQVV
jgi:hypothetical protein